MIVYMKTILSIGAGYVGVPTMAICALHCPEYNFICSDCNRTLINKWNSNELPIYEPSLDLVINKVKNINLFFTNDIDSSIKCADIIFISVCTPTKIQGIGAYMACDLSFIENVAKKIRDVSTSFKIIVEKSTVPIGTGTYLSKILNSNIHGIQYDVVSNPEFLAEGTAINDLENPHRVLIGCNKTETSEFSINEIVDLYKHWIPSERIVTTDRWTSELSKLAANAFLAQRISSINSMSMICEKMGGNIMSVSKILGMDERVGKHFLNCSVGFGGSCFKKDILDLVYLCEYYKMPEVANYWRSVIEINELQKKLFFENILHTMYDSLKDRHITIFGYSFKKNSGDIRETPAVTICKYLLCEGAILHIYDPKVPKDKIYNDLCTQQNVKQLIIENDPYTACDKTEAIAIITGWDLFNTLSYERIYENMEHPACIFDGCNILDRNKMKQIGFVMYSIGICNSCEQW